MLESVLARTGTVDLWCIDLDAPEPGPVALDALLDDAERDRGARFLRMDDRRRFVVRRAALRRILASYVSQPPSRIALVTGPWGKPFLPGGPFFNLSSSGSMAVCAVRWEGEVGVDLERVRPVPEADSIAARCFAPEEYRWYATARRDSPDLGFARAWVRWEACQKALGRGIVEGEKLPVDPDGPVSIEEFVPAPGHVVAVALAPPASAAERVNPRSTCTR